MMEKTIIDDLTWEPKGGMDKSRERLLRGRQASMCVIDIGRNVRTRAKSIV